MQVCLGANALFYPNGGGHLWVYINWALGLQALGCQLTWLEGVDPHLPVPTVLEHVAVLKQHLQRYGFSGCVALCSLTDEPLSQDISEDIFDLTAATEMDLLLSIRHDLPPKVVERFRRSAMIDIDPGILQYWMSKGVIKVARHDVYFTIGETVGQAGGRFPDGGVPWQYTPPCVALDWWPLRPASRDAAFTTVSHWGYEEWMEDDREGYANNKRTGFLPFLDLPQHSAQPLELALCLDGDTNERLVLQARGWRVCEAWEVTATPWDYQRYIQNSLGEFSCAKPSYVRLQNAWISDRTLCYLASGKPAIVQHTGPSRFLPNAAGLFRFRNMREAMRCLEAVAADYEHQSRLARALAEEYFDAHKVISRILERM
jgi:hypothetical protein